MLFDFDRFTNLAKLAYRRCECAVYDFEDALYVFKYYFETYEELMGRPHPMISVAQIQRMIEAMPYLEDSCYEREHHIEPEQYEDMIDQHFATQYRRCDYNINHFFSGKIRELRYYEVC